MLATLLALQLLALPEPPPPPDSGAPPAAAPASSERTWYGWQTLIVDGSGALVAGTGFLISAAQGPQPQNGILGGNGIALLGVGLHLFGPPVVHVVHGHGWRALGSFGFRVGAMFAGVLGGGLATVFIRYPPSQTLTWTGMVIGGYVMALLGSIPFDATRLAWEPTAPPAPWPSLFLRTTLFAGSVRGTPVAGLAGVF